MSHKTELKIFDLVSKVLAVIRNFRLIPHTIGNRCAKYELHQSKKMKELLYTGYWDCVAAVERLHALHYSVDIIFLSFGIMGFIVEL